MVTPAAKLFGALLRVIMGRVPGLVDVRLLHAMAISPFLTGRIRFA
jgi:hypothetical protein